jgi:Flp pilus assembly protein TadD
LELEPDDVDARNNLGTALQSLGRNAEAIAQFEQALKVKPDCVEGHYNLGNALAGRGQMDEAISQFQQALKLNPDDAQAHTNLGAALLMRGKIDEAIAQFRRALEIEPGNVKPRDNLGKALASRGQFDEAIFQFEQALKLKPGDADAHGSLAWLRATCPQASLRNGAEAIKHAERANQLSGGKQPDVLHTLAAAYAEAGRFPEALATVRKALDLATQQNNRALADALRARIALYEARKPYHQTLPDSTRFPPKP